MNDEKKTKAQLIEELKTLRKQLNVKKSPTSTTGTRQKQTELELRESEKHYRSLVHKFHGVVFKGDKDWKVTFMQGPIKQLTGYTKEEMLSGKVGWSQIVHPDDLERVMSQGKGLSEDPNYSVNRQYRIIGKDGKVRWVSENIDPAIDEKGRIIGVQGTLQDITDHKQAEEKLQISDLRLNMVCKAGGVVVWDWNIITNELDWSDGYCQAFGYSEDDTLPTLESWSNFIHPDNREHTLAGLQKVIKSDETKWSAEYRFKKKDGSYAFILDWGTVIHDDKGKPVRMVGAMLDITESKQTQQDLKTLVDNTPAVVYRCLNDGNWTVDFVSEQVEQLTGYPASDFLSGKIKWRELHMPEDLPIIEKAMAGISSKKKEYSMEFRIKTSTGKVKWVMEKSLGVYDDSGRLDYIEGFAADITDSKNIQLALHQSETKYKTLYETSQDAITIVDPEQGFISANPAAIKLFGFKNEQELLFKMVGIVSPRFQPDGEVSDIKIERMTEKAFKNGSHFFEWQHRRPDGSEFLGTVLLTAMELDGEKLLLASTRDVTEQRKAKEAIKDQLDFENLITEVSTSFINLPVERTDTGINIALGILSKFLKVDRSSIVLFSEDLSIADVVYEWCGKGIPFRRRAVKDLSAMKFRWWITRLKKGEPIYMHSLDEFPKSAAKERDFFAAAHVKSYVTVPIFFNKELIGFMNFYSIKKAKVWDAEMISLLKIVAEIFVNTIMRSRSQRELREYDAKMFRTEQLASLGIISANIAHELNQPLTVIQLLLQQVNRSLTKKPGDIAMVKENIDDSLSELTHAVEIVARFRTFARQSSPSSIERIDVCKIAESLVKALSSGARKTLLKLSLKKPRKAVYVRATAADIEQLFFVLIQNSIQAANPKAKNSLDIKISCKKNNILLDFKDNCGGVPEELAEKIFEPFFTTKPRQKGTGLGLPILERIVSRYEGVIKYENRPGHGIFFHISLPMSG